MYGWRGTILRVDLTQETITRQPLDESVADSLMRDMGLDYELRSDIRTLGGVIISDAGGRVRAINTVEERLNRAREKLRMQVSGILFEEDVASAAGGG